MRTENILKGVLCVQLFLARHSKLMEFPLLIWQAVLMEYHWPITFRQKANNYPKWQTFALTPIVAPQMPGNLCKHIRRVNICLWLHGSHSQGQSEDLDTNTHKTDKYKTKQSVRPT